MRDLVELLLAVLVGMLLGCVVLRVALVVLFELMRLQA